MHVIKTVLSPPYRQVSPEEGDRTCLSITSGKARPDEPFFFTELPRMTESRTTSSKKDYVALERFLTTATKDS